MSGLAGPGLDITETRLKNLFETFGDIDYVEIYRDPDTELSLGFAILQYNDPFRSKQALKAMNNLAFTK